MSIQGISSVSSLSAPVAAPAPPSSVVMRGLHAVDQLQHKAEDLTQAFAAGKNVELHQVVLATQEAQLGLDFVLQVRNKMIDAYQEMMRMPM